MTNPRLTSKAPQITGFEPIRPLGRGGFAEVLLYQQYSPRRRLAMKVLITETMGQQAIERLGAEADAMAELSAHPHIVTVYGSGLTDDGRPYLAMEYCPKPSLNVNFRTTRRSVTEVLQIGVQIAGAVETAHRAGILHRDIKPANILVTQYDNPALTDFGIAISIQEATHGVEGLSVPWSPPEAFAVPPWAGPPSDVWGLAATVYSLLAGRAPFEIPGADNSAPAQMDRIQHNQLPAIGRADLPASLEQVLTAAMAKDAGRRYATALAFGRALQRVQSELSLEPTRLVIQDEAEPMPAGEEDDEPATRLRGPLQINPTGATKAAGPAAATAPANPTAPGAVTSEATNLWRAAPGWRAPRFDAPAVDATQLRQPAGSAEPTAGPAEPVDAAPTAPTVPPQAIRPKRRKTPLVVGIGVGVVAVAAAAVVIFSDVGTGTPGTTATPTTSPQEIRLASAPIPTELAGTVRGDVALFTWTNPEPEAGDAYLVAVTDRMGQTGDPTRVTVTQTEVPIDQDGRACIEVRVVRSNGYASSTPAKACTP